MKLLLPLLFSLCFTSAFGQNPVSDTTKTKSDSTVFLPLDVHAEFPGGIVAMMDFIERNKKYPKEARKSGIEGQVGVMFIVGKDGSIDDVQIFKGLHPALDAEAVRIVKMMPNWKPGQLNGKAVNSKFVLPIIFKRN